MAPGSEPKLTLSRARAALPRGLTLPQASWDARHHALTTLLWTHVPVLFAFGLVRGYGPPHVLLDLAPVVVLAVLSGVERLGRRGRAATTTIGLLTCSAVLTHLWGGQIEAHFHFFVMVTILAAYEDWVIFGLAFGFVGLEHGVVGALAARSVYDHADAIAHPWRWAGIHAFFIAGLGVANILHWGSNERARTSAQDALRRTEASELRMRRAFEDAPLGMAVVTPEGQIVRANAAFAGITGYVPDDLTGTSLLELTPDAHDPLLPEGDEVERRHVRSDGAEGWGLWQFSVMRGVAGEQPGVLCQVLDITTRRAAERQLAHQASHDGLTGLPNRALFADRLGGALAAIDDGRPAPAVLFVDLDDFKVINDSLGHGAGDRLLRAVAERLRHVMRPQDLLARFGGDEFMVLLEDAHDDSHARRVAERLAGAVRAPFALDGQQRFVTASVGIVVARPGDEPEALLRDADAAMYRAKELGKARCEVFDAGMRARAVERLELETGLRRAAERDELRLEFQPVVLLNDGSVVGAEALLRWEHPTAGLLPPGRFIPVAEQSGAIVEIGAWVIREAARWAARWQGDRAAGEPPLVVSVNVSPRQLGTPLLHEAVAAALAETGIPAETLCLEITENAIMADPEAGIEALKALKTLGVRLAIDDFGVGHSSLAQLKHLLPVDALKIDKSFVDGLGDSAEDEAIVTAVVELARALGLMAVAEGVEHPEQAALLRALDCEVAQGFHFARPVPPERVSELLRLAALGELAG
jgi:diguanylate cyclase (GGDEF)-like protein/PAS domain S-box-containing protein